MPFWVSKLSVKEGGAEAERKEVEERQALEVFRKPSTGQFFHVGSERNEVWSLVGGCAEEG